MKTRVLVYALALVFLLAAYPALAQPSGGGGQNVEQWAMGVAGQLYRAAIAVGLIGLFASVLALAIAYVIPSVMVRNFVLHFGGTSLIGSIIALIIVMAIKVLVVTIVGFIDPSAANQLSSAFEQLGGLGGG